MLKAARGNLVLSGHIHCRRPVQIVEGIQFYKAAAITIPQWRNRWTDGNPRLGFHRFWVTDDDITSTFIPLTWESTAVELTAPAAIQRRRNAITAWPGRKVEGRLTSGGNTTGIISPEIRTNFKQQSTPFPKGKIARHGAFFTRFIKYSGYDLCFLAT